MKIRSHLLLIALLAGIPGLVVATLVMWWSAELQRQAIHDGVRETARAFSQAVERELYRGLGVARAIAASPAIDHDLLDRVYNQAAALTDQTEWIVMTNPDGSQVLNSLRPYGDQLPRVSSIEVVKEVVDTGRNQFGNLVVGAVAGRPIVTVGAPVIRDGQVRYVVLFASGVERFQGLLEAQTLPKGWVVSINDRNGLTIARNVEPERWVGRSVGDRLGPLLANAKEGTGTGLIRDEAPVFFAWTTSSDSGWSVAVGAPTETVNAPLRTMLVMFAIAAAFVLACIVIAIVIGRRVNQQITKSVSQLSEAALAMGEGAPIRLAEASSISEMDAATEALRWAYTTVDRRAWEQERERQEAVEANRAKDQFIATLAHEVRTPLAAIAAASEVLERAAPGRESAIIKRQVKHLATLVNELLDAARVAMNKFVLVKEPLNLTDTIRQCIDSLSVDRDRYELSLHATEDVWIQGDEPRIQQIVSNLVTNAIKFTPQGGRITIKVARRRDLAAVEVADPGIGIPPELLPRVFDLFVQGDRLESAAAGLGIGLSLVRRLVELHGGEVHAFSEGKDKGSVFTIAFPCIEPHKAGGSE